MTARKCRSSRFPAQDDEPLGPLANLVDIMLVFACGLIAALFALSPDLAKNLSQKSVTISEGRELPELPEGYGKGGAGLTPLGQVYRDPKTGKLILIGQE